MRVYSLKNCDTCKKALKWLTAEGIAFENHDVRADGLTEADVQKIVETAGWETALNRRSTTWRGLNDAAKADVDNGKAVSLILDNPTLMKRPVFVSEDQVVVGFTDETKAAVKGF